MLPGLSGFDLLRELRTRGRKVPVLMLTARSQETDKVRGLRLGADDYVTKPFGLLELIARIEALLRRTDPGDEGERLLLMDDVKVDFKARKAWRGRTSLSLTPREFEILEFLHGHRGEAVSREELLARIWGTHEDVEISTRTVDQHVAALRRKFGDHASDSPFIETVYGFGYRLSG